MKMAAFQKLISRTRPALNNRIWQVSSRWCSGPTSCLYIPGKYGMLMTSTVIPDLDIEKDLSSQDMAKNLSARKIPADKFNLNVILNGAKHLQVMDVEEEELRAKMDKLNQSIEAIKGDSSTKTGLDRELKKVKEILRSLQKDRSNTEIVSAVKYIQLPNRLDDKTPLEADCQLYEKGTAGPFSRSHVEISLEASELEITSFSSYYLFGRLAQLELDLAEKIKNHLLDAGLDMMACPDLIKTLVVEGCNPSAFLHPEQFFCLAPTSDLPNVKSGHGFHLVGGASLYSSIGHLVKQVIQNPDSLPLQCFSIGRQYTPSDRGQEFSLFNAEQSTAVYCSGFSQNTEAMWSQFDKLVQLLQKFYDKLDLHYRIVEKRASELEPAQSYRISFELFSPALQDFVPVGDLSVYNDFLSKRLMLKTLRKTPTKESKQEFENTFVVAGTAINVTRAIGAFVEQK